MLRRAAGGGEPAAAAAAAEAAETAVREGGADGGRWTLEIEVRQPHAEGYALFDHYLYLDHNLTAI